MELRYKHSPLFKYLSDLASQDVKFDGYHLVIFKYATELKHPVKWSERRRDLISKRAKVLTSEWCVGYLLDDSQITKVMQFAANCVMKQSWPLDSILAEDDQLMICGYRWYESKWVEIVDKINFGELVSIEFPEKTRS